MKQYKHAVIIAGGKSSRMGKDKALLPFGKFKTLTRYQYTKLQKLFSNVYISSKENKFDFEAQFIYDTYEASSPLVALLSIFETIETIKTEGVFILSVDAPFVGQEQIAYILEQDKEDADVIIAKSPSGEQPLCGLYKKSILLHAQRQYKKGNHKLRDLLKLVKTVRVEFSEDAPFANLNHLQEYNDAFKLSTTKTSSP